MLQRCMQLSFRPHSSSHACTMTYAQMAKTNIFITYSIWLSWCWCALFWLYYMFPWIHIISLPIFVNELTRWGQDKMAAVFADGSFKCIFLNENILISMKTSLKFVPKGLINNIKALAKIMAWRWPGDKPLSGSMMLGYRRIYASLGFNEL